MSSKLYKNGKLTHKAKEKLQKRLEKENRKSTGSSKQSRQSNVNQASKSERQQTTVASNESKPLSAGEASTRTPEKKTVVVTKASELTMDDITDTPPRQKLVRERQTAMDQNNDVNWVSLIGHNQIEAANEEKLYKKLEKQSNDRFRADLDQQMTSKQTHGQKEKAQSDEYRQSLNKQYQGYTKDETDKEVTARSKMLALKEIRSSQAQELNYRRKYEELKQRKYELRETEKLKAALKADKLEQLCKKEQNMGKLQQMLIDNEAQKKIKQKEAEQQELETIRLQKQYAQMLKEQEEKREKTLRQMYEKQQRKFDLLISATADVREKEKEDAIKAEKELKRRQLLEDGKERQKKQRLQQEMDACKVAIDAQMKEKYARIKREIIEDKAYGERMNQKHEEYENELSDKKKQAKLKQQQQKHFLEQQIGEQKKRKQEARSEMSQTEKLMNKQLLDEVRTLKPYENKNQIMLQQKESAVQITKNAPFQWRYAYRKAPF